MEKLEHQFAVDETYVEIQLNRDLGPGNVELNSEAIAVNGDYVFSENQLSYFLSVATAIDVRAGVRYEDWNGSKQSSIVLGLVGATQAGVEYQAAVFWSGDLGTEVRVEGLRRFELQPGVFVEPNLEYREYSRQADALTAEIRLIYAPTDKLELYAGLAWTRNDVSGPDERQSTGLVGLSYRP